MNTKCWKIEQSGPLSGSVSVDGAKNAVLVTIASLLLTRGTSYLYNVPASSDVFHMLRVLEYLGATVHYDVDNGIVCVDTRDVTGHTVPAEMMQKMRASILVMGPLLARCGKVDVTMPGGCVIGSRPIDMHLRAFEQLGVQVHVVNDSVYAEHHGLQSQRIILEYQSVGATENALMLAARTPGTTTIVNAALEPEVFDVITVLRKMGVSIQVVAPATIQIASVDELSPIEHTILADRLEAGALLLAAAGTGGHVHIPNAPAHMMDVFLEKLRHMGHTVTTHGEHGVTLWATSQPRAVTIRTMPYPGFPTDLQAPMMAVLTCAHGESNVWETVYENRMVHVRELQKLGAYINADAVRARIHGVDALYGDHVIASDIRAGVALVIAGLMASGHTTITGIHHIERGHGNLLYKLQQLGALVTSSEPHVVPTRDRWSSQQVLE